MARKRDKGRSDAERDDPLDQPDEDEAVEGDAAAEADDDTAEEIDPGDKSGDGDEDEPGDGDEDDISDVTAPSVGPHTTFEKDDPEERLARHEQSNVDAMGLDKRREVVGGSYSPSVGRQLTTYGIVLGVIAAIAIGFVLLANKLDEPPEEYKDEAPWSQADAEQVPPPAIDFPEYGHPGPGESAQATPGETEGAATSENAADVETP